MTARRGRPKPDADGRRDLLGLLTAARDADGGGKRGCVGAGFARQEAVLVLARLCRHYRLDLASPGLPRPRGLVTLRPAGHVPMRLTRRG